MISRKIHLTIDVFNDLIENFSYDPGYFRVITKWYTTWILSAAQDLFRYLHIWLSDHVKLWLLAPHRTLLSTSWKPFSTHLPICTHIFLISTAPQVGRTQQGTYFISELLWCWRPCLIRRKARFFFLFILSVTVLMLDYCDRAFTWFHSMAELLKKGQVVCLPYSSNR